MTITNKTSVSLKIMGSSVGPNETWEFPENAFNTLSVHSDIGSCVITTEYSQRTIENFGKLVAKEGKKKNDDGMREIIISSKD